MNYNWVQIGDRIKQERKKAGLSQSQLMNKIGRLEDSYRILGRWEKGITQPNLTDMLALCNIFDCELGYLLCEYNCKTREITDIQEVTGLSAKSISKLVEYKLCKNYGKISTELTHAKRTNNYGEEIRLNEELRLIDINPELLRVNNSDKTKTINILLENDDKISVIENIAMFLLCEFADNEQEKYSSNHINLYNRITKDYNLIKYSDISDTYLLKLQAQLLNLKDSILKEREPNK